MRLPVMPPLAPMLARTVAAIPPGASYEPKWDGFRAVVFRDGDEVVIGSRGEKPLNRYFPELVDAVLRELPSRCVVDGEVVVASGGELAFETLQARVHPAASRIAALAHETPVSLVAFDLLAVADEDLTTLPFADRRAALAAALTQAGTRVHLTPATTDAALARAWFTDLEGAGLDGVVAKALDGAYQPGRRGWSKVKHERTADCVVAGYRLHASGPDSVGSLLLGLYGRDGRDDSDGAGGRPGDLTAVGVVAAFTAARRRELLAELAPLVTDAADHPWGEAAQASGTRTPRAGEGSRWNGGRDLSFVPLRPELVLEVAYDHLQGERFRHTAQFRRWRPDRDPASCTYAQLERPPGATLGDVVPGLG